MRKRTLIIKGEITMFMIRYKKNGVEDVKFFTISFLADMWIDEEQKNDETFEIVAIRRIPG